MSDIVQISTLGTNGRFGNQMLQYGFTRTYAERVGARLETPAWIGQRLFGLANPQISCALPQLHESAISGSPADWVANVDLVGWFQLRKTLACVSKQDVCRWFTFKPEWLNRFPKKLPRYAACHLRQGDFPTDAAHYCLVSRDSYKRALAQYVPADCPVIWVEEDTPEICATLPKELDFLPDFLTLFNADILLRSNSTYAWWAGELGNHEAVYSPKVVGLNGPNEVEFVPGNAEQHAPFAGYGPLKFGRD